MNMKTEDQVRDYAGKKLGFANSESAVSGVGQLTSFNQLGFIGVKDRPDGWYLPNDKMFPAIILEVKAPRVPLKQAQIDELLKNCDIASTKYKNVIGILYNGEEVIVFKNGVQIPAHTELQNKEYYLAFFTESKIDKQRIYTLTAKINNCLHFEFGIKDLKHRMIFTACALVAKRYGANLMVGMNYQTFHTSIHSTLAKSFQAALQQNIKLNILLEVYSSIKMNSTENQAAIDNFILWVSEISDNINSDYWNGEDVMAIFFNEFNRYKGKSESGQVFTPDHITSLMYRLIEVGPDDCVLDAACGSGAFLVKSMCNMIRAAGGNSTAKAKHIKQSQLFGIEFDREIYALACANMLIHKDGKTNLEQLDTRTAEACEWMRSLSYTVDESGALVLKKQRITKVLMNPPFERKYGCITIVDNVLRSVPKYTLCAFILPDKKLEKDHGGKLLKHSRLLKIIKLPENVFSEGVTTSIFIFEAGVPHGDSEIFACYIEDDGLETVKNQGRQDIKDRWQEIEDRWVEIIRRQSGDDTVQWIRPTEHLSYQKPEKEFEIFEEDFTKTMMDYLMFQEQVDVREFGERLVSKVMYNSTVEVSELGVTIVIRGKENEED